MLRASTTVYLKAKVGLNLEGQKEDSHLFTAVNVILSSISASLLQYDVFVCFKCIALYLRMDAVIQRACTEELLV